MFSRHPISGTHLRLSMLLSSWIQARILFTWLPPFPTEPYTEPSSLWSSIRFCQINKSDLRRFNQVSNLHALSLKNGCSSFIIQLLSKKTSSIDTKIINVHTENAINKRCFSNYKLTVMSRVLKWHPVSLTFEHNHLSFECEYEISFPWLCYEIGQRDNPEWAWPNQESPLKVGHFPQLVTEEKERCDLAKLEESKYISCCELKQEPRSTVCKASSKS